MKAHIYKTRRDNTGVPVNVKNLKRFLEDNRTVLDKNKAAAISFHELKKNGRRCSADVIAISAIAFDFDDGLIFSTLANGFKDYSYVAWTTHSHTNEHPKYRVVIPFDKAVNADAYGAIWRWFYERFPTNDVATKDAARLFYLPSHKATIQIHKGHTVNTENIRYEQQLLEMENEHTVITENQKWDGEMPLAGLVEILNNISPDVDYQDWLKVCFGVRNGYGEQGLEAFVEWSSLGRKYDGYDKCRDFYMKSIPNGNITMGSVKMLAGFVKSDKVVLDEFSYMSNDDIRRYIKQQK